MLFRKILLLDGFSWIFFLSCSDCGYLKTITNVVASYTNITFGFFLGGNQLNPVLVDLAEKDWEVKN